jgi:hypothetical protein
VKFEGEWMTPAEQQSIQRHRSSAAEAERATERAREAEARAKEAEAKAREAEAEDEGIPLYWGWGTGPAAWRNRPSRAADELPAQFDSRALMHPKVMFWLFPATMGLVATSAQSPRKSSRTREPLGGIDNIRAFGPCG